MKRVLGLDLGTNSIGWALTISDEEKEEWSIAGAGARILPMGQDILGKFDSGQSISATADRTEHRSKRRLYQRANLRRDRLHRLLNLIGYLPTHYAANIDFEKNLGQFKTETKLNYTATDDGYRFIFMDSFLEMANDFKVLNYEGPLPYDWTIYYLRAKALSQKISKEELAWIILNFNQKRGYYQLRGEDLEEKDNKEFVELRVKELIDSGERVKDKILYDVIFENGWKYDRQITKVEEWQGRSKEFVVTKKTLKSGQIKLSFKAVDSEKDWPAIKAKTEQSIQLSGKTVGKYIYDTLLEKPDQKIRGKLVKTIERKFYKYEIITILDNQAKYHKELTSSKKMEDALINLYPKNAAHRKNLRDKDLRYLIVEDILFYQRPLKSKKSTIGRCSYEYKVYSKKDKDGGNTELKEYLKAISKSHPLYQEFRLWQFVSNIRIIDTVLELTLKKKNKADVTHLMLATPEEFVGLYDFLNNRSEVEQKNIIDYLVKKSRISKEDKNAQRYRWNYVSDKKYPCNTTRADFLKRLNKVKSVKADEFLTKERELHLWHIIYSVKDKVEFKKALEKYAKKYDLESSSFFEAFKKTPPYKSDYASLSYRAISKLLPLMRMGKYWSETSISKNCKLRIQRIIDGEYDDNIRNRVRDRAIEFAEINHFQGLPLWLASYIVYDRHSELGDIIKWKTPDDINQYLLNFKQHSIRNPIVEQVVTETLRVVSDIWQYYGEGKANFFTQINLELGREMKSSADKRKRISAGIKQNENTNSRIKELLVALMNDNSIQGDVRPYSPSHQELLKLFEEGISKNPNVDYSIVSEDEIDRIKRKNVPTKNDIVRYKLWLEQGYISPYTGAIIPLSRLYTTDYEIEHIIPQSRYFDNSFSNKVICESDVNRDKGHMTAYEYLIKKGGEIIDGHELLTTEEYERHCQSYFKKNRTKLTNLLSEDIPEGFINRQMNDSRYISKYVKSLLSNIVRSDGEQETTSKNLLPVSGAITAKLKRDWGLNDKWNELIAPRFKRLNELTSTRDYGFFDKKINTFRITVPDEVSAGFSKKRIDHRHHALDALVLAFTTRDHVNYLNSLNADNTNFSLRSKLLVKNKQGDFTKHFKAPFNNFAPKILDILAKIVVSFKQNTRVINKANNKTWQWVDHNGQWKKRLVRQEKGVSWAIRKPLHKETVSGKIKHPDQKKSKIATATRVSLESISNQKHIDKISDPSIRKILYNHLHNYMDSNGKVSFSDAFSQAGIEDLNHNIIALNGGKPHMPIKKVRQYEIGSKFQVGETGNNPSKYVEAAKGTNLFFAIYWDPKKQKRVFETVPLNEVIEHQKQVAHLPKSERLPIKPNPNKGQFLFTLSPNDLVYVPSDEELDNLSAVDFDHLSKEQTQRIYKMVSCTGGECHFIPISNATEIVKNENGTNSKSERIQNELLQSSIIDNKGKGVMIKERCILLKIDKLGLIRSKKTGQEDIQENGKYISLAVKESKAVYKKISFYHSFQEAEKNDIQEMRDYLLNTSIKDRMKKTMELIRRSFTMRKKKSNVMKSNKSLTIIKSTK